MEEINKYKSLKVKGKALAERKLLSRDIMIIADTAQIKKQLKQNNSQFFTVNLTVKINRKKFPVMIYRIKIILVNCSKQDKTIY